MDMPYAHGSEQLHHSMGGEYLTHHSRLERDDKIHTRITNTLPTTAGPDPRQETVGEPGQRMPETPHER